MKIFALIACAVLMSPVVAQAQNAPAPENRPELPGVAANTNQPAPSVVPNPPAPGADPAPAARPNPAPRSGQPGARPMPGRPGMQRTAPRIITTAEAVRISGGESGETVIYNGVRISVPPGVEAVVSMDGEQIKVDSQSMDGITIGNATYNSIEPGTEQPAEEEPKPAAPATVFVNPADGSVSVPKGGTPVFVTVRSGDVIEINTYISLKGDVSGALSQESPAENVLAPVETPKPAESTQQPATTQQATPEQQNTSSQQSSETTPAVEGSSSSDDGDIVEIVDQETEPTVAEETQGERIKEEEVLSPSAR